MDAKRVPVGLPTKPFRLAISPQVCSGAFQAPSGESAVLASEGIDIDSNRQGPHAFDSPHLQV